eukprot:jgi/Chlat1/6660/Chrsp49S06149
MAQEFVEEEAAVASKEGKNEANGDASSHAEKAAAPPSPVELAKEQYDQGVKCLRKGENEQAIDLLGKALEIFVTHYGELAAECAPFYYRYGGALFYKAQAESDVFGEKAQALAKQKDAEDEEEDVEEEAVADAEQPTGNGQDKGKGAEEEGEEDILPQEDASDDMELAWQTLETARLIYSKQPARSVDEAEVISLLGEISAEREDFETALADYKHAQTLYAQLLQNDDRRLAEIFFKMLLAHEQRKEYHQALQMCQHASAVFRRRIDRLRSQLLADQSATASSTSPSEVNREEVKKEIQDLEEVLEDITLKESELKQMPAILNAVENGTEPPNGHKHDSAVVQTGFDKPANTTGGTTTVCDLGVVGRGTNRVTLTPVNQPVDTVEKRRGLQDLLGGGDGANVEEADLPASDDAKRAKLEHLS